MNFSVVNSRLLQITSESIIKKERILKKSLSVSVKAMLHEAIFLATCNAMMTNEKTFQVA